MRRHALRIVLVLSAILIALVLVGGGVLIAKAQSLRPNSATGGPPPFTWTTSSSNTSGYITYLDNANTNNQPNLVLEVSQVWPNNYDPHPVGVWYDTTIGKWTIFNEDVTAIPLGTSFNVFFTPAYTVPSRGGAFQTTATTGNSFGDYTLINNALTNNLPSARLLVTQDWTGTYDPHEIGVWYTGSQWAIFNEDKTAIPAGATFDVSADSAPPNGDIIQTTTSANIQYGYITYINDPDFNGDPNLHVIATQVWNAQGNCGCIYNNHTIGVWYDPNVGEWTVYNVDLATMPVGAAFVVTFFE